MEWHWDNTEWRSGYLTHGFRSKYLAITLVYYSGYSASMVRGHYLLLRLWKWDWRIYGSAIYNDVYRYSSKCCSKRWLHVQFQYN